MQNQRKQTCAVEPSDAPPPSPKPVASLPSLLPPLQPDSYRQSGSRQEGEEFGSVHVLFKWQLHTTTKTRSSHALPIRDIHEGKVLARSKSRPKARGRPAHRHRDLSTHLPYLASYLPCLRTPTQWMPEGQTLEGASLVQSACRAHVLSGVPSYNHESHSLMELYLYSKQRPYVTCWASALSFNREAKNFVYRLLTSGVLLSCKHL